MSNRKDPMIRAMKASYKASYVGKLDALLREQSKWQRRRTIANNKLVRIQYRIEAFAMQLAVEKGKP